MSSFFRALRIAWSYRLRFGLSVICALLVAILWGGNLTAVYPILKIFFHRENLQDWIAHQIATDDDRVQELEQQIAAARNGGERRPEGGGLEASRSELPDQVWGLEHELSRAKWTLQSHQRLQPLIERFVPPDRGRTLVLVMVLLVGGLALK